MAKMKNCALCGAEVKSGLFSGDAELLDVGDNLITLCPHCYAKYKKDEKLHAKRFGAKLRTYLRANKLKKLDQQEIMRLYAAYRQEGASCGNNISLCDKYTIFGGGIKYTNDGLFSAMEFSNDFLHTDISATDMIRSARKATNDREIWFTKDDITRIELVPNRMGTFCNLFTKAYSYTIRFNDQHQLHYRPCITRVAALGHGFAIGYRKSAEKKLMKQLEQFRQAIGTELPVVICKK